MSHTIFDTPIIAPLMRLLAHGYLWIIGFKLEGPRPEARRYILLAAPHTSNMDFPITMALAFAYRIKIRWMGKKSLFRGVRGPVTRWLGGISVDRNAPNGLVGQIIDHFNAREDLAVVIAAEGTRGKAEHWKSGFYHIARGANIPIVPGFVDYKRKRGGFGEAITLTGDMAKDMDVFRAFYEPIGARFPERKSKIRFAPTASAEVVAADLPDPAALLDDPVLPAADRDA